MCFLLNEYEMKSVCLGYFACLLILFLAQNNSEVSVTYLTLINSIPTIYHCVLDVCVCLNKSKVDIQKHTPYHEHVDMRVHILVCV